MKEKYIQSKKIRQFIYAILRQAEVRSDVAACVADGLVQASLRGVDSHGIRLLPHYLSCLEGGRLNKSPKYIFKKTSAGTGLLNGDSAPGHAAGTAGMQKAIGLAKKNGIGAVGVFNSSHFGAAAFFAFQAVAEEMIGLSFTHATAHVLPFGGVRPFIGNNPICLAAPCAGEGPFCFDMATTVATFNKVQQYKEQGRKIPFGWAVDKHGRETDDPSQVLSLLPIGGYKGFGLSLMVEILCSLLTGAPFGQDVSRMFGTPRSEKRRLGHFFIAIRIDAFQKPAQFKKRLKELVGRLRCEPAKNKKQPIMAPGDPEKNCARLRSKLGIPVPMETIMVFNKFASDYKLGFSLI